MLLPSALTGIGPAPMLSAELPETARRLARSISTRRELLTCSIRHEMRRSLLSVVLVAVGGVPAIRSLCSHSTRYKLWICLPRLRNRSFYSSMLRWPRYSKIAVVPVRTTLKLSFDTLPRAAPRKHEETFISPAIGFHSSSRITSTASDPFHATGAHLSPQFGNFSNSI